MNKIRKIRKEQKITLKQLSETTGISLSYISNLEREKRDNPSYDIMKKICITLKSNINDVFKL